MEFFGYPSGLKGRRSSPDHGRPVRADYGTGVEESRCCHISRRLYALLLPLDRILVIAVVVIFLPAVGWRLEHGTVPGPHFVDKRIPSLALAAKVRREILAGGLLDGFHECRVVLEHPPIDVIEERIMAPRFLGMHQPQGQRLGHPTHARAAAAIRFAGDLPLFPGCGRRVLVGPPRLAANFIAADAGGGVDPGMT